MFSGPRFTKPTHSYGEPLGDGTSSPVADGTSSVSCPESSLVAWGEHLLAEENWAGKGFEQPYEEQ